MRYFGVKYPPELYPQGGNLGYLTHQLIYHNMGQRYMNYPPVFEDIFSTLISLLQGDIFMVNLIFWLYSNYCFDELHIIFEGFPKQLNG